MRRLMIILVSLSLVFSGAMQQAFAQSEQEVKKKQPLPATPTAAWVIEGLGGITVAAGFTFLGLGYGTLNKRDRLYKENANATEVLEAEDQAIFLSTTGWIVTSIGLAAMIGGAIWILTYDPTPSRKET